MEQFVMLFIGQMPSSATGEKEILSATLIDKETRNPVGPGVTGMPIWKAVEFMANYGPVPVEVNYQ